jgi:hypothetical protein
MRKSCKKPKKDYEFHMQDAKITSGSSWLHTLKSVWKHYMVRISFMARYGQTLKTMNFNTYYVM